MIKQQLLSTGLALLLASSLPFTALADTTDTTVSIRRYHIETPQENDS